MLLELLRILKMELKKFKMAVNNNKKWIIAGAIGVVTILGAIAYLQYKKIMDYTIKFKRLKINSINLNSVDFNLYLLLENKSSVEYTINSQEYSIYVNDKFLTKLQNQVSNVIKPKSFSEIGLNVKLDLVELRKTLGSSGILSSVMSPEKVIVKIDMKLKVSIYGFTINIPYSYTTSLKEIMTPATQEEK